MSEIRKRGGAIIRVGVHGGAELPVRNGMAAEWKADAGGIRSREGWFTLNGPAVAVGARLNVAVPAEDELFDARVTHVDEDGWHFFKSDGAPCSLLGWLWVEAAVMKENGLQEQLAELAKCNRFLAQMAQPCPTSDALHGVAAECAAEQPPAVSPCPIGHDKLADPCKRLYCGCGCTACKRMCGEATV